jgi:diguanylate cyclase (GGDEF)-like protein
MIDRKNIFNVYRVDPQDSGKIQRRLAGKVMIVDGILDVLADYDSVLGGFKEGPMSTETEAKWAALQRSSYFEVVPVSDIIEGRRTDLIPEEELPSAPNGDVDESVLETPKRPASEFLYHHPNLSQPMAIRVDNGTMTFNGFPITDAERDRIMDNVRTGAARIRYNRLGVQASIQKMEQTFEDLVKIEPHLENAIGQLRAAVKAGHIHPDVMKALTGEIFNDPMVPGIGNKKAYADFRSRPREGVHIGLDGNSMKSINDTHGHEMGDHAIKAMGGAIRAAMDEAVGRGSGKVYRNGGDEFNAHVPTMEHAARFARVLREKLDAVPPIGGTHRLSMSLGFGANPEDADKALYHAKAAKKAAAYGLGQDKTHAHSLFPGHEGPIPVSPEQLPISKPAPTSVAPALASGATSAPASACTCCSAGTEDDSSLGFLQCLHVRLCP